MKLASSIPIALCVAATIGVASAQTLPQTRKVVPAAISMGDVFGHSIALDGTTMIVGASGDDDTAADAGAAYLIDAKTGAVLHVLYASDAEADDKFGYASDIHAGYAVVGAPDNDDLGPKTGAAYIYDVATGAQLHKLASSNLSSEDEFGSSASIRNGVVVVGAWNDGVGGGAYVFDAATGAQITPLARTDPDFNEWFGRAVATDGTYAVVGCQRDDENLNGSGSAYVFDALTGAQLHKLIPFDGGREYLFGCSVSVDNGLIAVGSRGHTADTGLVYLYDAATGAFLRTLTPDDAEIDDEFGTSVCVRGDKVVVGAPRSDDNGDLSGSAYLFDANTGQQLHKLLPSDTQTYSFFGNSVSISGDLIVTGAFSDAQHGSAYVFELTPCNTADFIIPFGVLDFSDVLAFLNAFSASAPEADLAAPMGQWDFNDVAAFLAAFAAGCP